MRQFPDACEHHRQAICLLAAGALSETERGEIESHLAMCAGCQKYHAEIKAVTGPLANWEEDFARLKPSLSAKNRWARAVQATSQSKPAHRATPAMAFHQWYQDVLWPYRRTWSGLAAVWLLMAIVNFSQRDHSTGTVNASAPVAEMASFHDQQKLLNELLADRSLPVEADRPRLASPKPRTEVIKLFKV